MINREYQKHPGIKRKIRDQLKKEGVVELQEFLDKKHARSIAAKISRLKFKKEQSLMSHSYSYSDETRVLGPIADDALPFITSILPAGIIDISIIRMRHKDYILLHEKKEKMFIICLSPGLDRSCGGYIGFSDSLGNARIIEHREASLVLSNGRLRFFVKYINNKAKNKSIYLIIGRVK